MSKYAGNDNIGNDHKKAAAVELIFIAI